MSGKWCLSLLLLFLSLKIYPQTGAEFLQETESGQQLSSDSLPGDTTKMQRVKAKIKHTGSLLYRFVKSFDDYDTLYISPNYYNYTAMLQNTNFYQLYRLSAQNSEGDSQSINLSPLPSLKIGPYIGWRWIFLGYAFDVSHPHSSQKNTEYNLSLYSSMLGCDFVYIRNTGDFVLKKVQGFDDVETKQFKGQRFTGMNSSLFSANVYYVFNHRHFSYPAAFAQSTVQRKSCGSMIFGLRYDKQKVNFDYTQLPQDLIRYPNGEDRIMDELKIKKLEYYNYSISGGYAYNWVFARNCLLAVSCAPSIGFKKAKGERLKGNEFWVSMKNLNFDVISRMGIVWNNTHWFAGASLVSHLYDYRKDRLSFVNSVNYLNVYVGFNFHRKRQYR